MISICLTFDNPIIARFELPIRRPFTRISTVFSASVVMDRLPKPRICTLVVSPVVTTKKPFCSTRSAKVEAVDPSMSLSLITVMLLLISRVLSSVRLAVITTSSRVTACCSVACAGRGRTPPSNSSTAQSALTTKWLLLMNILLQIEWPYAAGYSNPEFKNIPGKKKPRHWPLEGQ